MTHRIAYSPAARRDIMSILNWIEAEAGPVIADDYVDRLEAACESLTAFPNRGTPRRAGLRSIVFGGRAIIFYRVGRGTVTITAVLHRGRDPAA